MPTIYSLVMKSYLRIFVGTSIVNKNKGTYALTVVGDEGQFYMPTCTIVNQNMSSHRLVLTAFLDLLKSLKSTRINGQLCVIFYANDDLIAYEFNTEHKQISSSNQPGIDDDIWKEIQNLYPNIIKKLEISVKGTNTILKTLNKQATNRAYRTVQA